MSLGSNQTIPVAAEGPANPGVVMHQTILGDFDSRGALRSQITSLMLKGAGYAAVVYFGAILFVLIFHWIGMLLPEESKFAPDPSLETTMILPAPETRAG